MSEDDLIKPHLTKRTFLIAAEESYESRWVIMCHRHSDEFVWSDPKDFADACRYLKASDGSRIGRFRQSRDPWFLSYPEDLDPII